VGWNTLTTSLASHLNDEVYSPLARALVAEAVARGNTTLADFETAFNRVAETHARSLVIVMVPLFALLLFLLNGHLRRYYVEHLIFALHFFGFWLVLNFALLVLTAAVLAGLRAAGLPHPWQVIESISVVLSTAALALYLYGASLRVYGESVRKSMLKTAALTVGVLGLLGFYRFLLFFTTLWSL